ncbi:MAG: hypothetical protein ACYTF6_13640 [Planctomycetota bacterium]|jgi:hypothetical protein
MAATVGELVVNLVARTSRFNRGMESAGRKTTTFASKMKSAGTTVAAFGAALGVAAAAWRAVSWFKQGAADIDRLAKVSRKLGTTVEELNALRHAADLAGIASNTLDMALQRMTRRMAEAAVGTGEAQAALKELGVDAKKLAAAGPYQALLRIADAMREIENPADRLRLAFKLFDSEGAELVNMLDEGSQKLEEIKRRMDALGGVTSLGAKNVEAMNDAFKKSGMIFTQQGRNRVWEALADLGAWSGLTGGTPYSAQAVLEQRWAEAEAREKRQQQVAADVAAKLDEVRQRGEMLLTGGLFPQKVSPAVKMMQDYLDLTDAVGMSQLEVHEFHVRMSEDIRQHQRDLENLEQTNKRMATARGLIAAELRGDDGAFQLPAATGQNSAEAYSAIVRRGLQPTAERTEKEILETVRRQLREQERTTEKIDELVKKLDLDTADFL